MNPANQGNTNPQNYPKTIGSDLSAHSIIKGGIAQLEEPIAPEGFVTPFGEQRLHIRQPDHIINGQLTVPAALGTTSTAILLQSLQTGLIKQINLSLTGASAASASLLTVTVQSSYGEVYFQSTVLCGTAPISLPLIQLSDMQIAFKNGLNLVCQTGVAGTNTGQLSIQIVWTL